MIATEVLEGTISRRLLEQALKQRNTTVSQQDVDAEVACAALAMGQKTADGMPDVEKWLELVTKEQGLPLDAYMRDSVWPSVALKKLAGEVKITNEDLQKGFEANYGTRVRCRAIVLANQRKAQEVWEKHAASPRKILESLLPSIRWKHRARPCKARFRQSNGTGVSRFWKRRPSRSSRASFRALSRLATST